MDQWLRRVRCRSWSRPARHNRYAEAIAALADKRIEINRDEHAVWHVRSDGNPFIAAGQAATELKTVDDTIVVVEHGRYYQVLIACVGRTMLLVDSRTRAAGWRLYELTPPRTPASLTHGASGPPPGWSGSRFDQPPPEVATITQHLAIDLTRLARDL